jgi:Fe-S-cluster containining protein
MDRTEPSDPSAADTVSPPPEENLCSGCVACCHAIVGVTHVDLALLAKMPTITLPQAVRLYSEEEFEADENDPDMAMTARGRRMLALRSTENGCKFLEKNGNCGIYDYRPRACRSFPYEIDDFDKGNRSLTVLQLATELNCKRAAAGTDRSRVPRAHVEDEEAARLEFRALLRQWDAAPIAKGDRTATGLIEYLLKAAAS